MATSPNFNGNVITLYVADTPFKKLLETIRLQSVILTPGSAAATLTLYEATDVTDATKVIMVLTAVANGTSVVAPMGLLKETPFTVTSGKWISATLAGTAAQAFIYYS